MVTAEPKIEEFVENVSSRPRDSTRTVDFARALLPHAQATLLVLSFVREGVPEGKRVDVVLDTIRERMEKRDGSVNAEALLLKDWSREYAGRYFEELDHTDQIGCAQVLLDVLSNAPVENLVPNLIHRAPRMRELGFSVYGTLLRALAESESLEAVEYLVDELDSNDEDVRSISRVLLSRIEKDGQKEATRRLAREALAR